MQRTLPVFLTAIILTLFLCTSCPIQQSDDNDFVVSVWNVQNIFNAVQDGNEYNEYLPSGGWTEQAYQKRLSNLSTVCSYPKLCDSDIFVFNEIENDAVAEDILNLPYFKKKGFCYYATAGEQGGAIRTAVLSRIPIIEARIHSIQGVRPVLQIELQNLNEKVFILAVHGKSNREGVDETATMRLALGNTLKKISDGLEKNYPDSLIIIAGDFNESYENKNSMSDARSGNTQSPLNLLPDFKSNFFYCPWLDSDTDFQAPGSYNYKNEWKQYDNILVSKAGKDNFGWEFDSSGVVFQGILQTTDFKPNAYRRDLLTGVSDHLPLWIRFTKP